MTATHGGEEINRINIQNTKSFIVQQYSNDMRRQQYKIGIKVQQVSLKEDEEVKAEEEPISERNESSENNSGA